MLGRQSGDMGMGGIRIGIQGSVFKVDRFYNGEQSMNDPCYKISSVQQHVPRVPVVFLACPKHFIPYSVHCRTMKKIHLGVSR